MDKIEPTVDVSVDVDNKSFLLQVNAWQLLHRQPGDLLTVEIVDVFVPEQRPNE